MNVTRQAQRPRSGPRAQEPAADRIAAEAAERDVVDRERAVGLGAVGREAAPASRARAPRSSVRAQNASRPGGSGAPQRCVSSSSSGRS